MFSKPKHIVLEQTRREALPTLTPELKEAILSLRSHPGFEYLTRKLRLQRSALEAKLKGDRFGSLTDVEFIQSGIFWVDWLDNQVQSMSKVPSTTSSFASPDEEEALRAIEAQIEVIR